WDAQYLRLADYRAAAGDCRVPQGLLTANGARLGAWTATQRSTAKAGKLSPDRLERLDAVGFVWDAQADRWGAYFAKLTAFTSDRNHCVVPSDFTTHDGTRLGPWVALQRHAHATGKLSVERTKRLEGLGFAWTVQADLFEASFEPKFAALQAYIAAHSDCAVPSDFVASDGTKLGLWVDTQRKVYNAGDLAPYRAQRFDAVGLVWRVLADAWDAHFELLEAYRTQHGDCAVP
ncbi:helicase associated domain-containing protein, partial [Pelagophyceae sp. CCMP2097]